MKIETTKGWVKVTELQELTFQLLEDWLWSVIERGAPAPDPVRAIVNLILEGEMPPEEMVSAASHALVISLEEEDDCDGMTKEEIPTTDDDPDWVAWCEGVDKDVRDGQDAFWVEQSARGLDPPS